MPVGEAATIWMARGSAAMYFCSLVLLARRQRKLARAIMSIALVLYLVHIWGAFEYFYTWSHTVAVRETARQTLDLFGVNWRGGLYLNYLFTGVWTVHCGAWWGRADASLPARTKVIHAFLVFMFVNATVVVWILRAIR